MRSVRRNGALGVVHIPKTGGTAIRSALHEAIGVGAGSTYFDATMVAGVDVQRLPEPTKLLFAAKGQLRSICRSNDIVMGHFSAPALLSAGCGGLAVQLREPRARLLSLYRYWQSQSEAELAAWGPWGQQTVASSRFPFDQFLQMTTVWAAIDNTMARQLLVGVVPQSSEEAHRLTTRALNGKEWKRIVDRLAIAEWSSDSQRFADRICNTMRVEPVAVKTENITVTAGEAQVIDRNCRDRLSELTRLDQIVLDRLMQAGALRPRTTSDLEREFTLAAARLGFEVAGSKPQCLTPE
jgi:hypothetical protein